MAVFVLDGVAFVLRVASFSEGDNYFAGLILFVGEGSFFLVLLAFSKNCILGLKGLFHFLG